MNCRAGFTLVETLVAISIFTLSLIGIISILASGISDTNYAKQKITAEYLAQEGIESVRNMRDTYVLYTAATGKDWNSFTNQFNSCHLGNGNGCGIDSSVPVTDNHFIFQCSASDKCNLYAKNGSYSTGATNGIDSGFTRVIRANVNANQIQIVSDVSWSQGSGTYHITFSENLFNWIETGVVYVPPSYSCTSLPANAVACSGTGAGLTQDRNYSLVKPCSASQTDKCESICSAGYTLSGGVCVVGVGIGDAYLGGKVGYILQAGDPGYDPAVQHGLIAATADQTIVAIPWYNGTNTTVGTTSTALGTGRANSDAIIASQGPTATNYAAGLARAYTGGGYSDWYLPSKNELNKLFLNKASIGGFIADYYWSSSEDTSSSNAWSQDFGSAYQYNGPKRYPEYVRAVRSF